MIEAARAVVVEKVDLHVKQALVSVSAEDESGCDQGRPRVFAAEFFRLNIDGAAAGDQGDFAGMRPDQDGFFAEKDADPVAAVALGADVSQHPQPDEKKPGQPDHEENGHDRSHDFVGGFHRREVPELVNRHRYAADEHHAEEEKSDDAPENGLDDFQDGRDAEFAQIVGGIEDFLPVDRQLRFGNPDEGLERFAFSHAESLFRFPTNLHDIWRKFAVFGHAEIEAVFDALDLQLHSVGQIEFLEIRPVRVGGNFERFG